MRILLTAATIFEIQPVVDFLRHQESGKEKGEQGGVTDYVDPSGRKKAEPSHSNVVSASGTPAFQNRQGEKTDSLPPDEQSPSSASTHQNRQGEKIGSLPPGEQSPSSASAYQNPDRQALSRQTDQALSETLFFNGYHIQVLVAGIGIMNTAYSLTDYLGQHSPDYVLQAGIGGSFSDDFPPLSLAFIKEEVVGDLGVEENGDFKDLFDLGFMQPGHNPYTGKSLVNPHTANWAPFQLPFVRAITINEMTTRSTRINVLQQKYEPVVESMEGSALHYVCLKKGIPFMQLRSISNKVGDRDKTRWKIKEAIALLNEKIIEILLHFPTLDE